MEYTPSGNLQGRKPRSILIGRETLLAECGRILQESQHEIVAVVAPAGPAADWARRAGLPLFARSGDLPGAGLGPVDYLFSITNLQILAPEVLALASRAAINFHDGPLPAYAGLNTPSWALLSGEREHAVTWHLMIDAVDCGDVLGSEAITIDDGETSLSLNTKCFEAGLRSFASIARDLESALMRRQPLAAPPRNFFGREQRPEAAGMIDWRASAEAIARLVSALDFGTYRNPLGLAKTLIGDRLLLVQGVTVLDSRTGVEPGTVLEGGAAPVVATGGNDLRLDHISTIDGSEPALVAGDWLVTLDNERRATLSALDSAAARYEGWWHRRLAERDPLLLPQFLPAAQPGRTEHVSEDRALATARAASDVLAAWVAYLGRAANRDTVEIGYVDPVYVSRLEDVGPWFADQLPLHVTLDREETLASFGDRLANEIGGMHKRVAIARDLFARMPDLRGTGGFAYPVTVAIVDRLDQAAADADTILHLAIAADGSGCRLSYDASRIGAAAVADLWDGFEAMLASASQLPEAPLNQLSLLSADEFDRVIRQWNAESGEIAAVPAMHHLIAQQAQHTPDRVAVTSRGRSLTYAELDRQASRLARHLHALGVGPDVMVGLNVERSVEMVVCLLAIHKAGGAYVPLDPAYPRDRLAHMIADSGMSIVVTQSSLAQDLPQTGARMLCIDQLGSELEALSGEPFDGGAGPENLAYVIYTSGSTGLPKGVMVEHRNLLNFFAGMDRKLEPDGTWLAVTSLSFDISVLEVCWPLTRGYHVVIATEREVRGDVAPRANAAAKSPDFSLFYFASSDSTNAAEQYRLLMEGARYADANGFEAVWTPERHFHAFGGPYPNPSVISAALAAMTSRVKIRAGSVVATLHHPARIAEEWALVDNLSNGRVGIAFASGWQPNDFVFNPANFADRSGALKRNVEDVRALWRGEPRSFPGALGEPVELLTYPRPIQPELPVWITSAGNVATFEEAGRSGAFVLTHLLGQNVQEVAEKVAAYRRAWQEAGHAGQGHVTLMLHTFVGENADEVRSIVREPLIEYLRTSTSLLKQYAWSFPTFRRPPGAEPGDQLDLAGLGDEEMDALLEHSFNRYFETSGLFGTPEDCLQLIRLLSAIGVNEIGCLIDFGIATDTVLESLPALNRLRQLAAADAAEVESTLPELMVEHGVTHLQCTPSLLNVLASDGAARPQLTSLKRLMVGGEAFPPHLARDMLSLVDGAVMNMYGPTETTIWSTVHTLEPGDETPPLGRPLVNQQVYVVDRHMRPVRPGAPGELVIAGDGVVRGYLNRPELTAERFIADPIKPEGRAYRTGDLVRQRADGTLEFMGRLDHQVKVRGYRIELGEIEAALAGHPQVVEAVVIAHRSAGAGDARLVAYLVPSEGSIATDALRVHLRTGLPEFMVPASFIELAALPRTPNGKIDRKTLPDPDSVQIEAPSFSAPEPANAMETQIQNVWCDLLKLPRVGLRDNFFDIGGHSLLAVQLHRRLAAIAGKPVSLTDIFRFPTVATLAAHLSTSGDQPEAAREGQDRAQNRRAALQRRGAARALVRG